MSNSVKSHALLGTVLTFVFTFGAISVAFADAPVLSPVSIASNNASSTLAKPGDLVTLTFTSNTALDAAPIVSIDATTTDVTVTNTDPAQNIWLASKLMTIFDATSTVPFFQIVAASTIDSVTSFATTTATTDGSEVTFDAEVPTLTSAKINGGNQVTLVYSEPVLSVSSDYSGLTLTPGGARTITAINTTSPNTFVLAFDGLAASTTATAVISIAGTVNDLAGNALAATTTVIVDGQAPKAPGTPVIVGPSLINAALETAGFAPTVSVGTSEAVLGDTMKLLLNGSAFPTPSANTIHIVNSVDLIAGYVVFAIPHGELGADGVKAITAAVTDVSGNTGPESPALSLTLDTVRPTLTSAKITAGNQMTLTYSEPVQTSLSDYAAFTIGGSDGRAITALAGSGTASVILTFDGSAASINAAGAITIAGSVVDSAGNAFIASTAAVTDGQAPSATLSYSKNPARAGDTVTITATFNESMADSPVPSIALSGANTLAASGMTMTDDTHYAFPYVVGAGDGAVTASLSLGTDSAGNVLVSAPISGAQFNVDNTAPTAAVTYSGATVKAGDLQTISIVTSEAVLDSPVLTLSVGGANTVATTSAAKVEVDTTHYTFAYTALAGDGNATVLLADATDAAGNGITPVPTSGTTFVVDNTAPLITITNPNTNPAQNKIVLASVSDGTLTHSIISGGVCGGTLEFVAYAPTTFTSESDNTKQVCYKAVDAVGNISYSVSDAISGIDTTAPVITALTLTPNSSYAKIGDMVTVTITAGAANYSVGAITINGLAAQGFVDLGGGMYAASTTVQSGDTDWTAGTVPASAVLTDAAGNSNIAYTAVTANILKIDAHAPTFVSARTTSTTTIDLTFSEDLNGQSVTNSDYSVTGFTLTTPDAFEVTPGVVRVAVSAPFGTNATPAVTYSGTVKDLAGNVAPTAGPITSSDGIAPVISETTPVIATTNDNTPDYVFISGEAGAILYGGDCSGATVSAIAGSNTVTFNTLAEGAHANCTIGVTDSAGNASNQLSVPSFTVDTIIPTVALSSAAPNRFNSSPISVTATFFEPVVNFVAGDVVAGNGTVANFAGSGSVYTFDVTPAGQGTMTVDIAPSAAEDLAGNNSIAAPTLSRTYDTAPPVITVDTSYNHSSTNQDITVTVSTNEGTLNTASHTFSANGSFDFVATDAAGNSTTSTVTISNIDKTAPVFTAQATVVVEAATASGAVATYAPTAIDAVDGTVTVSCTPASGSTFAIGTTAVTCSATDAAGNSASVTFNVTIQDTTAPVITLSGSTPVTVEGASTYTDAGATAADAVDGNLTSNIVTLNPVNTAVVNTYSVTYTVSDTRGNAATQVARAVNVIDTTAPTITAPANQTFEATGALTTPTFVPATATDAISTTTVAISHTPTGFAVGTATVTWTATDGAGNSSNTTSQVTITDTTAPSIAAHATVTASAASLLGANVSYTAPVATDLVDGTVAVSCSPASGSLFAIGTTTATCASTDAHANTAASQFFVIVARNFPLTSSVSLNLGAPDVVVSGATVATSTITVPEGVSGSRLDVSALAVTGADATTATIGGAVAINSNTSAGLVSVALPGNVVISGPNDWNGVISLPVVRAESPTPIVPENGMKITQSQVIEVGAGTESLSFSKAVRLLLPGQSGKLVGSTRSGAAFVPITTLCTADEQGSVDAQLGGSAGAACKISVEADLVIWTNHFTSFVTYTQTLLPANGPIGTGGIPAEAVHPTAVGVVAGGANPNSRVEISTPSGIARVPVSPPVSGTRIAKAPPTRSVAVSVPKTKQPLAVSAKAATSTSSNIAKAKTATAASTTPNSRQMAAVASTGTTTPSLIKKVGGEIRSFFEQALFGIKSLF